MRKPALDNKTRTRKIVTATLLAALLALSLSACGFFGSSTLHYKEMGVSVTFPCKYEERQYSSFTCKTDLAEFWVKGQRNAPTFETRKSIYEGFVRADQNNPRKKSTLSERESNGFRILEHTVDQFDEGSPAKLVERKKIVELFKDGSVIELTGTIRSGNQPADFENRIKNQLDSFFGSLKL